jgi:EAL domain-containing protein (putative c-di-GMP-specific phosphodiesterase class I)
VQRAHRVTGADGEQVILPEGARVRHVVGQFGAGFGSFYYLKHLPADILKIDGEFIAGPRSQIDELVIQSIVQIARQLGKHTVAEYVGDEETVRALREWGVDFAQGFHNGRPFPAEQLVG